jgi:hypothetical protein
MVENLNTKVTKYTKEGKGTILQTVFLRDLCVLCGKKELPSKNGRVGNMEG